MVFRTNVMSAFNVFEAVTALGINRVRLRIERVHSWLSILFAAVRSRLRADRRGTPAPAA
jgi:hypothetical protein